MAQLADKPSTRVHYMLALARSLRELGGSGTPGLVYRWLEDAGLRRPQVPPAGIDVDAHYQREVRFARQELADSGLLRTEGDRWALAQPDVAAGMTAAHARRLIGENRRRREARRNVVLPAAELTQETPAERPLAAASSPPGPTTGPPPTEWTAGTGRTIGLASTYAFRFQGSDLWKIGYSSDITARLAEVNRHVPVELIGSGWEEVRSTEWPSQRLAFAMEQEVLRLLSRERTAFERARCSTKQLTSAWDAAEAAVAASIGRM